MAALSHLPIGRTELTDLLTQVANLAVSAIPGADGVGVTLLEPGHADTIVASDTFVAEIDAIQYGIVEGPCISAVAQATTVYSGELDTDPQWPRFGPQIGHLGVHSALSIPLRTSEHVLGAMNVYAHQRHAFDEQDVRLGELFAVPAAIAVQNAQVLAQARRLATQLQAAVTRRAGIDQAIGILMSQLGCSPEEGAERLGAAARLTNEELHTVAGRVVREAVRRAEAATT